jgi:hypothetical protein
MGWLMPESSNAWWDDDSHPDARAHREFLKQYGEAGANPSLPRRKAANPGYISKREFERFQEYLGKAMAEELAKRDARIKELEERPVGLNYAGVFKPTASYPKHSAVSHAGSVWCAKKDFPSGEPGTANSGWQLVCKRGRDGKDGKNGQ